ncbi:hypothetical protein AWZ03_000264 [Drosophila navojoa]|uniref:BESS domain-containing protein n=1 Tax=Drosophila navojoa TaxID=7232 RepID=A0A484BX96_DRONA|nr:uncharacterized protein LOC108650016 [Drosophila navojoa]TDG53449.1 hypothetical protein AWZ03_000264 [Drosophila navojoa]
MSKVRRLYHQKYREDWERFPSFSEWLCRGDDGYSAHCKICDANVLARLASIKQHHNTAKHQKALKSHQLGSKSIPIKMEPGIKEEPKHMTQKYIFATKPKPKIIKRSKPDKVSESIEQVALEPDTCSNDSILEDLLGNDDMEQQYLQEISDTEMEQDVKPEAIQEFKIDEMQEENLTDDNIISEFDLFGKSVSLQLNHMELEDALLCQERLQVVLTEFRLKILKRKSKRNF